jgi:ADP-heptose:LPS heptosyltransferase
VTLGRASGDRERLLGARRIAVIRTDRIGDLVLTLPMFGVLRRQVPRAELHLVCREYAAPAAAGVDTVDQVHLVDREPGGLRALLVERQFDAAFLPRGRPAEAWDAVRAGVSLRVGSGYRWYSFLYNHRVYDHRSQARFHEAEYNTRLVASVLGEPVETLLQRPSLDRAAVARVGAVLTDLRVPDGARILVLHPGTGGSTREWPARCFGEMATRLLEGGRVDIALVTGTGGETGACRAVVEECAAARSLCGALSLPEMMALVARASLLVANSTGVLHLAAALGTPVVGLYPATPRSLSPQRWRPWTDRAVVLTPPPEWGEDMGRIPVAGCVEAATTLLGTGSVSDRGGRL